MNAIETFDAVKAAEKISAAIKTENEKLLPLNIMILGKTGVGKSTLINCMFNQQLADTGVGKPITRNIRKISKKGFPLAIYDTPGLELGGENSIDTLLEEVISEFDKGIKSGNVSEAIHCIWYCISTPSRRIEQAEIEFLKKFLNETDKYDVPVIVVLTQAFQKNDANALRKEIEKENLSITNIVPVLAKDQEIDEEYTAKAYGLDRLTDVMNSVIPEALHKTFVAVQKQNLKLKKERAQLVVATASVAAATAGAIPIPFSDAAVLVPIQIAMLTEITVVYGLPIEKGTITAIVTATIGTAGTTLLGKTIVTNLLKCIPGVGSVVGGVISGATAAALTAALGETHIIIMSRICKGELSIEYLSSDKGKKEVAKILKEQLKIKRNEKGEPIA